MLETMTTNELFQELQSRYTAFVFVSEEVLPSSNSNPTLLNNVRMKGSISNIIGLIEFGKIKVDELLSA